MEVEARNHDERLIALEVRMQHVESMMMAHSGSHQEITSDLKKIATTLSAHVEQENNDRIKLLSRAVLTLIAAVGALLSGLATAGFVIVSRLHGL